MNNILKQNETMGDVVRRLEASFDMVRDIAPIAYWYENLNEDGSLKDIHYSDEMRRMLGYKSRKEYPDTLDALLTSVHPDDVQIMLDNSIAAETGKADKYNVQYRIRRASGDYMWCNATGQVIKDCNGRIVGMYGAILDITEEIELRLKQELTRSKELDKIRFRMNTIYSLSDMFDPVMVVDPESGEYDWFENKAQEIEELTAMFVHGKDFYKDISVDCATIIHKDDVQQFRKFYTKKNLMKIARTGKVHETENRWRVGPNGTYLWKYNKVVRMIDENGRVYVVVGVIDTTKAKEKEAKFKEQQKQMQMSLDLANQQRYIKAFGDMVNAALWSMTINDKNEIVAVNWSNELRRMFGFEETLEAFPNRLEAWSDRLHPDDKERVMDIFYSGFKSTDTENYVFDLEYRILKKNGDYCWYHAVGRMEYNDDGTRKFYGIILDISQDKQLVEQQKQLEAALAEAERINRRLDESNKHEKLKAEAIDFMQKNKNLESIVEFFSGRILELFGCDQVIYRDIEGRQILKERPGTKPLDFSLCANCPHYEFDAPVYAGGFTAMDDCKVGYRGIPVHPDCKVRASLTYLVYESEKVFGYIALHYLGSTHHFTDEEKSTFDRVAQFMSMVLSRRKHQEAIREKNARFEIIKDVIHSAEWYFKLSPDDRIVHYEYSSDIGALVKNEKASENYDWKELVHPDDLQAVQAAFDATVNDHSGKTPYDIIFRMVDRDGKYNWFRSAGRVIRNKDGSGDFFGIHIDVTETFEKERENQRRLEEALVMAQSANRAKTTFLNNMSHDIRTPMNAIIGFTGLAASHIDNREQVKDYLSKIGQASNHLLSLINDVLDMSRIESGKMNLDEKEENLADILHTLRTIVQSDIHSKQLDFYVDAVDVNDENVICDKLRLNQVLLNLLSNAIKYTPAGGTVAMRVSEKAVKNNGYASYEFIVKDNGMGMSKEFIETIFDPFTRVKSSTMSGIQGTGLGMAITKNIIDMMGGTIDIQSEPGKGTEVTVNFDFKLQNVPREPVRIKELEGLRALVIDDDSNTCLSISGMLRDVGMRDEWCTSGREAIIRAEQAFKRGDVFKVYIIDWMMPDMNGIETTRRIRKVIGDDVPIIILTSYDWSDIEEEARDAGVTAFVSKPMFPSDLHRVLNKCLGRQETAVVMQNNDFDFTDKKALLVEDNELNREIATELLTENGFIIETAEDGAKAVELMKDKGADYYDFILMDIQMPVMNGYEATKVIRQMYPNAKLPIIALSANAFAEDKATSLAAGMNDHVAKPIKIKELFMTLAKYLRCGEDE